MDLPQGPFAPDRYSRSGSLVTPDFLHATRDHGGWIISYRGEHMGSAKKLKAGWRIDAMYGATSGREYEIIKRATELLDAYKAQGTGLEETMPRRKELDSFTRAYIEAMLWSSTDDDGEPLDSNYDASSIASDSMDRIIADCADFQKRFDIYDDDSPKISQYGAAELAGHDFWLTRNGRGSGFWDGDWPKHGDELTAASKEYGEVWPMIGDDGEIHVEGGRASMREGSLSESRKQAAPQRSETFYVFTNDHGKGWRNVGSIEVPPFASAREVERVMTAMGVYALRGNSKFHWRGDGREATVWAPDGLHVLAMLSKNRTMREEGHVVRDFDTHHDLIEHARKEGASHFLASQHGMKLYFPLAGGDYQEADVFKKGDYWHTQAPSARAQVNGLPQGARAIGGSGARRRNTQAYPAMRETHAEQKEVGPYTDPSAAHERAMKLQNSGARNVRVRKTTKGWMISYVEYSNDVHEARKDGSYEHHGAPGAPRRPTRHGSRPIRGDRLFIGTYPTGLVYADKSREKDGDYARCAFLSFDTLTLQFEKDCPADLHAEIERHAARVQAKRGEEYPVSASGHTVILGGRGGALREGHVPHQTQHYVQVYYYSEREAQKNDSFIRSVVHKPLVVRGKHLGGYRMDYGPIDLSSYRDIENAIYRKLGNSVRVNLIENKDPGYERFPMGEHVVRDFEALDPSGRPVGPPFKDYYDAKTEAAKVGGYVKFVPEIDLGRVRPPSTRPTAFEEDGRRKAWGIWNATDQRWMHNPDVAPVDMAYPARYLTKSEAENAAKRNWIPYNPGIKFVAKTITDADAKTNLFGEGTIARESASNHEDHEDPEEAGAEYAQQQVQSTYFKDWVSEQIQEARQNPEAHFPSNTPDGARKAARNMLQQLVWDTKKEFDPRELGFTAKEDVREFFKGFSEELRKPAVVSWLADEVLAQSGIIESGTVRASVEAEGALVPFNSWKEVLAYAHSGAPLFYKAPMDHRATRLAPRQEQGQEAVYEAHARTIRIWPYGSTGRGKRRTADPFTADSGHLDRFSHPSA